MFQLISDGDYFASVFVFQVEAEEQPEISELHSVSAVPYFVFFKVSNLGICFPCL